ncbi:YdcF family protein [Spirochaeta isovalerica]|uniref:Uncharacterized SAM-binding protein YcdF (DUF218 family) n=1 Tax=Spirochaeta isovalerica TaxID=150 RepID=A0A841RAD1_9SPIO|nr:YdcF family protein [Spirochaeta isovalerica]MBB6479970.1 uncharacterized SAM-binding protein YcdF (DUF218 family) [Spirochaeta isovalerica]
MTEQAVEKAAHIIWDYHHMNHKLEKSDLLFVLGSHDIRVAEYAARLFREGWAPVILFSGGVAHQGDMLDTGWGKSEAEVFAARAGELGVPGEAILLETKAGNTGDNVRYSRVILEEARITFDKIIAVQKPYMERRTYATIKKIWADKKLIVTSPSLSYEAYPTNEISLENIINIMVGDLQRIIEYPAKGFQIHQSVPEEVMSAYRQLVDAGYDRHMIG